MGKVWSIYKIKDDKTVSLSKPMTYDDAKKKLDSLRRKDSTHEYIIAYNDTGKSWVDDRRN